MKKNIFVTAIVGIAAIAGMILWLGRRAAKEFDCENDEWITPFTQKKDKQKGENYEG